MSEHTKRMGLLFSLALVLFMAFQLFIYRDYAFEVTWLYAKKAIRLAEAEDKKMLGAICNSLGRVSCSERVFKDLVREIPGDTHLMANLAKALVEMKKYQEADPYFRAYFADGGNAPDVVFWYKSSLRARGLNNVPENKILEGER